MCPASNVIKLTLWRNIENRNCSNKLEIPDLAAPGQCVPFTGALGSQLKYSSVCVPGFVSRNLWCGLATVSRSRAPTVSQYLLVEEHLLLRQEEDLLLYEKNIFLFKNDIFRGSSCTKRTSAAYIGRGSSFCRRRGSSSCTRGTSSSFETVWSSSYTTEKIFLTEKTTFSEIRNTFVLAQEKHVLLVQKSVPAMVGVRVVAVIHETHDSVTLPPTNARAHFWL